MQPSPAVESSSEGRREGAEFAGVGRAGVAQGMYFLILDFSKAGSSGVAAT